VTVVGHAASTAALVSRGGALPGETIVLTGEIGGAAAGRLLLDDPRLARAVPATTGERLRARQLDPSPRLGSGRALAAAGARAMIDISDGLAADAAHIAAASGVALAIVAGSLPLAEGVREVAAAAGLNPLQLAASGGEDYELLATLPADAVDKASACVGASGETALTPIGEVANGNGVELRLPGGGLLEIRGFDHFADSPHESRSATRERRDD
jgi:thiamine-monophosphate kinase